jgi:hypothetical protein
MAIFMTSTSFLLKFSSIPIDVIKIGSQFNENKMIKLKASLLTRLQSQHASNQIQNQEFQLNQYLGEWALSRPR